MIHWDAIADAIASATGSRIEIGLCSPISDGCINQAWRLEAHDGTRYFVKLNDANMSVMFTAEAAGLSALTATHSVRVPQPVAHGVAGEHAFLVLEHLELRGSGDARLLGRQLAALHRHISNSANINSDATSSLPPARGKNRMRVGFGKDDASTPSPTLPLQRGGNSETTSLFGFAQENFIGTTAQPNGWKDSWIDFWREQRLGYQLELAQHNGYGGELQKQGELLMEKLPEFFADFQPVPSLLHGDLWGGNHAFLTDGTPVIFDPAPYYGDREADLAMTELFGGFDSEFYSAYRAAWPLHAGYGKRKILYNLYHILNHANLFGGGYASQAEGMMRRLLDRN